MKNKLQIELFMIKLFTDTRHRARNNYLHAIKILMLLASLGYPACAYNLFWIGTGVGVYSLNGIKNTQGLTQGMGNFNFRTGNLLIQARMISILGSKSETSLGVEQCVDAGLLGGYVWDINDNIKLNLAGGISFVYSNQEIKYTDTTQISQGHYLITNDPVYKTSRTVGVPIELELLFLFSKNLAVGIALSSNLNIEVPYVGIAAIVEFGILK